MNHERFGTIYIGVCDASGKPVGRSTGAAVNPHRDFQIVTSALELVHAIDRGVDIDPDTLYQHLTGCKPPRSAFALVGRYVVFKYRRLLPLTGAAAVLNRLRKDGFRPAIARLILRGHL